MLTHGTTEVDRRENPRDCDSRCARALSKPLPTQNKTLASRNSPEGGYLQKSIVNIKPSSETKNSHYSQEQGEIAHHGMVYFPGATVRTLSFLLASNKHQIKGCSYLAVGESGIVQSSIPTNF